MFDSVAIPAGARRRFGVPAAVSVALHLLVAALVPAMTRLHAAAAATPEGVFVLLQPRRPAPAAAPLGPAPAAKPPRPKRQSVRRPAVAAIALVPPVVPPVAAPPPEADPPAPAPPPEEPARPDGLLGATGVAAGSSVGAGLPTNADGRVEYDDALMTPPERLSGPDPEYTYLARAHDVQGVMVVKCVVTMLGAVRDCRVVEGLPYMEGAVVDALLRRRYTPARLGDGRAIEVEYTFRIRLRLVR